MIVDAEGCVLGRVCGFAAKKAMLGEEVIVINAEKTMISGNRDMIFRKELAKLDIKNLGNPQKGPFHEKRPDKYMRRSIRGMLPWHRFRGREAYSKVMVYIGAPAEEIKKKHNLDLGKEKIVKLESAQKKVRGVTLEELCRYIGGKF